MFWHYHLYYDTRIKSGYDVKVDDIAGVSRGNVV